MPPFPKPRFDYDYDVDTELRALRTYPDQPEREDRRIPAKRADRLLVATWNIANLGLQQRREKDHRLIAEVISWFDLIAVQEVNGDLAGLRAIQEHLPARYRTLFNDAGGNRERYAFLFDGEKVEPREEMGEVTIPATDVAKVRLPDIPARFVGFDRNPMLASFRVNEMDIALANVHLYFGTDRGPGKEDDEKKATLASSKARAAASRRAEAPPAAGMDRRVLEAYAVARWANARRRDDDAYTQNIIALGDFNLPVQAPGDRVYDALTRHGLKLTEHSTKVGGSNLNDDAHYDQLAVLPGPVADRTEAAGIFDFDGAVFRDLWGGGTEKEATRFRAYLRYYLSDHRPLWMALAV